MRFGKRLSTVEEIVSVVSVAALVSIPITFEERKVTVNLKFNLPEKIEKIEKTIKSEKVIFSTSFCPKESGKNYFSSYQVFVLKIDFVFLFLSRERRFLPQKDQKLFKLPHHHEKGRRRKRRRIWILIL